MAIITGLNFLANTTAGSDISIRFTGANFLSRGLHTAIWNFYAKQQLGYYACVWHAHDDGLDFHADDWEYGTHPYPANSASVESTGQSNDPGGDTGSIHYFEEAGLGAQDFIASPGAAVTSLLTVDRWYTQARTCSQIVGGADDGLYEHLFYFDLPDTNKVIRQLKSSIGSSANPLFLFGCSPWRSGHPNPGTNDETPYQTLRNFQLYSTKLSESNIVLESAAHTTNTPVTVAGQSSIWYRNVNPTPTDISDKSSGGHSPSWGNANRASLFTGTVSDTFTSANLPLGQNKLNLGQGRLVLR